MIVLRDRGDIARIRNPQLRSLIELRLQQLGDFNDGLMLVVEAADTIDALELASSLPLLHDPYANAQFPDPDFTPAFDYLEKHHDNESLYCYEAHADTGDDGLGTTLFIPNVAGIAVDLLAMCAAFATPAATLVE